MKLIIIFFLFLSTIEVVFADSIPNDSVKATRAKSSNEKSFFSPPTIERSFVPKDTTIVEKKSFSKDAMEEYLSSSDFQYAEEYSFTSSIDEFFTAVKDYFYWLMEKIFGSNFAESLMKSIPDREVVLYIITFALFTLIFTFFYKSKLRLLFYNRSKKNKTSTLFEENIHEINFANDITIAEDEKKFRFAIRLHFLECLKLLDTNELLVWELQKTNRDYLQELSKHSLYLKFDELVTIFDYVWYGEFIPTEEQYKKISQQFLLVKKSLIGNIKAVIV